MREPLVTIVRPAYKIIVAQAVDSTMETGGILVGRETRGRNCKVFHVGDMEHGRATKGWITIGEEQKVGSVRAAEDRWPELQYLGEWHSHVYSEECILLHLPAISEWDVAQMLVGKVEIVVTVFPFGTRRPKNRWDEIWVDSGKKRCCIEAWLRAEEKKVVPCRVEVR